MMFYRFLTVCQHFCICIIVCLLSCQCRQNEFIAQSLTPNRDVGDKYLTFQSLDARNLLRTNVRYNSLVGSKEHVVCQKAFINLHGITRGRVVGVANHSISSITSPPDRRGKHSTRPNTIPDSIREQVKDHVKPFPSNESHYSREHTSHQN